MIDGPGPIFADFRDSAIGTLVETQKGEGKHIEHPSRMQMLIPSWKAIFRPGVFSIRAQVSKTSVRPLLTLAIESSCDDTSVAVLEKYDLEEHNSSSISPVAFKKSEAILHFHQKITADNTKFGGIHPVTALISHQTNLANLIRNALQSLPDSTGSIGKTTDRVTVRLDDGKWHQKKKPDFITVTRGPGMYSSLSTGIDTAKGLAVAWSIPLVAVNHMQAHALTPRLVTALEETPDHSQKCDFPFLSLLVSGGHTLLVHSKDLTDHAIIASTTDIAIGDYIDKIARCILPSALIQESGEIMYGRLLEQYTFPQGPKDYKYTAPARRGEEIAQKGTRWGWSLAAPLAESRSGSKRAGGSSSRMEFSFSGLGSAVRRICEEKHGEMEQTERKDLGRHGMRVAFEHLASRVVMALNLLESQHIAGVDDGNALNTLVVSGGVAANGYLKAILRSFLNLRGFRNVKLAFPPPSLCTDNAAMIAWTGIEMYKAGWESELSCKAIRKWSIDPAAADGGILGTDSWKRRVLEN